MPHGLKPILPDYLQPAYVRSIPIQSHRQDAQVVITAVIGLGRKGWESMPRAGTTAKSR
jgi:hypothetical protein